MVTEQDFKLILAENLIKYRKLNGFTQAELADLISYSDKSVSKWERGEGVPDVLVLLTLSEIYGISIAELTGERSMSKETAALLKAQEKEKKAQVKAHKRALDRANRQKRREKKKQKNEK